jgi:hypothetical protein
VDGVKDEVEVGFEVGVGGADIYNTYSLLHKNNIIYNLNGNSSILFISYQKPPRNTRDIIWGRPFLFGWEFDNLRYSVQVSI